ncbi:MAG: hypothetical protein ACREQM_09395 [Candidatus Dormibacteraceae bacterium]
MLLVPGALILGLLGIPLRGQRRLRWAIAVAAPVLGAAAFAAIWYPVPYLSAQSCAGVDDCSWVALASSQTGLIAGIYGVGFALTLPTLAGVNRWGWIPIGVAILIFLAGYVVTFGVGISYAPAGAAMSITAGASLSELVAGSGRR